MSGSGVVAARRLALGRLLFETLPLFLLLLRLGPVAVGALLVVIGFESHVRHSLFDGNLGLLRSPRLGSARGRRVALRLQLLVCRLLGETKLAQPRRLQRHRLTLALLLELEDRFPLLASC